MHLSLSFGGPFDMPLPARLSACLQALARECKLPAQSSPLAERGGNQLSAVMATSVPGERGESSHRPPWSLRNIFWCLSITLCPWPSLMGEWDTSQKPPMIWVRHCMTGSRRHQVRTLMSVWMQPWRQSPNFFVKLNVLSWLHFTQIKGLVPLQLSSSCSSHTHPHTRQAGVWPCSVRSSQISVIVSSERFFIQINYFYEIN